MKIGDHVVSTTCDRIHGIIVALLGDGTGIVDVNGTRMYANLNYWVKVSE